MSDNFLADFTDEEKPIVSESENLKQTTETKTDDVLDEISDWIVDTADSTSTDKVTVEQTFMEVYNDASINVFPKQRRTNMAKALTKQKLGRKSALPSYEFVMLGKMATRVNSGKFKGILTKVVGLVSYVDDNDEEKVVKALLMSFPNNVMDAPYKKLMETLPLHKYNVVLGSWNDRISGEKKFGLNENSEFKFGEFYKHDKNKGKKGTKPEYATPLELYESICKTKVEDDFNQMELSEVNEKGYVIDTDWKILKVAIQFANYYDIKHTDENGNEVVLHDELKSVELRGIDFEGNEIKLKTQNWSDIEEQFPSGSNQYTTGLAIGTKTTYNDVDSFNMWAFLPFDEV